MAASSRQYENSMVAILGFAVGIMAFEQASGFYLMPFIKSALQLDNTEIGLIVSAYYVAFAVSSFVASLIMDILGKRKLCFLVVIISISCFSVLSGFAHSFGTLLFARALMGAVEAPIFATTQSIVAIESSPQRLGINTGIVGSLVGNAMGGLMAPVLLVKVMSVYGWHVGFFLVLVPGLICSALAAWRLREPRFHASLNPVTIVDSGSKNRFVGVLKFRNIWLCAAICCCFAVYTGVGFSFLPLYYVNARHFSSSQMGLFMSVLGMSAIFYSYALPAASDRFGRRPVMIAAGLLSTICPLAVLYYSGPMAVLAALLLVGWALAGSGSLFIGTIPSETVSSASVSTAVGLVVAIGALVGGLAGPAIAGWSADHWGLRAPLLLLLVVASLVGLISVALRETAPSAIMSNAKTERMTL